MALRSVIRFVGLGPLLAAVKRQHATGADLSALILPSWLDALLNHDRVAYPLHTAIGSALNWLGASPRVAALEWLKAAAHAESPASQSVVGAGLQQAVLRAQRPHDVRAFVSAAIIRPVTEAGRDVRMRRRQLAVIALADCDPPGGEP